uniref:Uncharacterized protein n=1 Tax=Rhizophora mucronata TaxID=61149 RepID=A0A2P2Q2J3_RHIMU
MHGLGSSKAY